MSRRAQRSEAPLPDEDDGQDQQQDEEDEEPEDGSPPATKRQRTAQAQQGGKQQRQYPRGTVKQVRVSNFMTYGEPAVTISPGPRLNLVLGPNGTGKSSLVCALCVGLGGSTKLLGRADNVKDFIRRGADGGWVETTLSGGSGRPDCVVLCQLAKSGEGYQTTWKINRVTRTKRDVQELVRSLNIQFENLCQFLPQDKVVEFARMDPYELLVATERAIGDASLHEAHELLITRRQQQKDKAAALSSTEARRDQLLADNAKLERDYQRFRRRNDLMARAKLLRKKQAWVAVKAAQGRAKAADDEATEAQGALARAKKEARQDEKPVAERRKAADAAKGRMQSLTSDVKVKEAEARKALDRLNKEDGAVREVREKLSRLQAESDKLQDTKDRFRSKLEQLQEDMAQLPPVPDHSQQLQRLAEERLAVTEQLAGVETERVALERQQHDIRMEHQRLSGELRQCDSQRFQRLQALISANRRHMGLDSAARWVEEQRAAGRFAGQVLGPIALEIRVRDQQFAAFLEQATFWELGNFVATSQADADLLMGRFKAQGIKASVNVVTADLAQPAHSIAGECRAYGVVCSLDQVFEAPPLVARCLADLCNTNSIMVMEQHDLDAARRLMEDKGVPKVYTPQHLLSYIRSAYGGKEDCSYQTSGLFRGRVLCSAGGTEVEERKRQLQSQLQATDGRISELQAQVQGVREKEAPLHAQMQQLQAEHDKLVKEAAGISNRRARVQREIKQTESHLAGLEGKPDPLASAPALRTQLARALAAHNTALGKQVAATLAQWEALQQQCVAELTFRELDMQARALQAGAEARRTNVTALETLARNAQARAKRLVDEYCAAKAEAEESHPMATGDKEAFADLPDDAEAIEAEAAGLELEAAGIVLNNPHVAEEYRRRQKEAEALGAEAAALGAELELVAGEIQETKDRWLPELQRVVGLINASFSSSFAHIGCAGEVVLGPHEDFDKFSIQIRVKFRANEELQQLTAHRQSGGERSVSTILYLVALQGVTVTPFRVVDEINQGMDPVNERKVFVRLVEAACAEGTPQCFLLTPKLLPDLPFTEDITVLNIFNGGLISSAVAGQYSREALFGARNMAMLARGVQVAS